ncbi:MAG: hypothetical protein ILP14_09240, partial [Oscillospiraceae bacterium]|nr:hypothetical protein [Oscillospiraceae bacterium]
MIDFHERSGLMQAAMIAEKPRKQAISGRFWAGRTYRGRIKDDHKIDCLAWDRSSSLSPTGWRSRRKADRNYGASPSG